MASEDGTMNHSPDCVCGHEDCAAVRLKQELCEHENCPGEGKCPDCGVEFIYCHPCSVAGGADRAIYHMAPECSYGN